MSEDTVDEDDDDVYAAEWAADDAALRRIDDRLRAGRLGLARLAVLETAAWAVLPAAHAGIHFAFHEGNAPEHGQAYRAAYNTLRALLEGDA